MKDGAGPEDPTCNLLNTSRKVHPTDLAGTAAQTQLVGENYRNDHKFTVDQIRRVFGDN